ncbi:MAG TPA: cell division protein FtsH, partial [Longimicrobiales bacterium]
GLEKKNRLINEKEREIIAYHEAGHAIVAERVETADPVHKISIIPRGVSALGYTQQLPTDDRYLLQRKELLDRLTVLLGGRAAEGLVFDEISTGAGNDLERASEIARRMIIEFGMSDAVGPVNLRRERAAAAPDLREMPLDGGRAYSEATAQTIDEEVRRVLSEARDRAFGILERDRAVLDELARRLLDKEVVDRAELRELMGRPPQEPGDESRPEIGHAPDQAAD